ncbi:hypothetical protein D2T29_12190 [Sinirhodobacter populi]|uniref:Uncharacterized protein n=1 Tax=Paenirhodobacter populi TaxID=2306993 RepID=A0A443KCI6_9RHOB|nr:hypothetical protein [Sinirhodobacter populi]RWR30426.1 hypothetical protein D2T29_12190 [Sinirhodobacter populi]
MIYATILNPIRRAMRNVFAKADANELARSQYETTADNHFIISNGKAMTYREFNASMEEHFARQNAFYDAHDDLSADRSAEAI